MTSPDRSTPDRSTRDPGAPGTDAPTAVPVLPTAAATGFGPLPGTDILETVRTIAGELPVLPFLPALPDRGVGADPVGRGIALLVDVFAEVVPSGWRMTGRPGRDHRRANDFRAWDTDAAEEHLVGAPALKLQVQGPWSLAALLELPNGHRALTDHGAVRDLTDSLVEGLRAYREELERRLPGTALLVQVDEPELGGVLSGSLPTPSGFGTVRAVGSDRVRQGLAQICDAVPGVGTVITGTAPGVSWRALQRAGFRSFACDLADLEDLGRMDAIGEAVQDGLGLLVRVPAGETARRTTTRLVTAWQRIGFPVEQLPVSVVPTVDEITAAAGVGPALKVIAEVARALVDPPESWSTAPSLR